MKEISQVKLNVYEFKSFPFGITLYHTSIEYDDVEYSFGICNNISGVYEMALNRQILEDISQVFH